MKSTLLSLAFVTLSLGTTFAQGKKLGKRVEAKKVEAIAPTTGTNTATTEDPAKLAKVKFTKEVHDFGNVVQGTPTTYEFTFKNTNKEPLVIQNARSSCGCTVPSYSKEPIAPGKTGSIKVTYDSNRVGGINKNVTVTTNFGVKTLSIKGNIEKAPEKSVPENESLIRTN